MSASLEPSRSAFVIGLSVALSFALHASALLLRGHSPPPARLDPSDAIEVALDAVPEPPASPTDEPSLRSSPPPTTKPPAPAIHRHSYPVPPSHDRIQHDPALPHSVEPEQPEPSADSPATQTAQPEPVRFVLRARAVPNSADPRRGHGGSASPASDTQGDAGAIFAESAVDSPARLVESAPLVYPDAARASEREADVALELIVASDGRVVSARALSTPGSGFELEAERAVRRYRFSAARRGGRPVSVRMRWMVSFRLR